MAFSILRLIPRNTAIDFVGLRWIGFTFTGVTIVATIVSLYFQGLNFGIDFTGGVLVEIKRDQTIDLGDLRSTLGGLGFGEVAIQSLGEGNEALIRVQPEEAGEGMEQAVVARIRGALPSDIDFRRVEVVGPKISGELFFDGILASVLAVLIIALYVAFRFEWQFGIAAIVATGHDVFVTVGLFSLTQLDFNLTAIAALLTLAGYSINDTVVVFDRIRENRRRFKKMPLDELINLSTNQMLTRTILTALTTAIAIVPLFLYGGAALFNFSAALLFGIALGTYSSIYVAASLLLYLSPISGMTGGDAGANLPAAAARR